MAEPFREKHLGSMNPDVMRSQSALWVEERDGSIWYVLQVKRLGAIVMRAVSHEGQALVFCGLSTFTDDEIYHA